MPYARPTLTQLRDQALQDIQAAQITGPNGTIVGLLQHAVLRVLAYVLAGFAYLHYAYQDWIAQQAVPWTATDEWLLAWGALKGVTQKDATSAVLTVTVSGTPGATVAAGTGFVRGDGTLYTAISAATVGSSGTALVTVQANAPGAAANSAGGTVLTLASAVPSVQPDGTVAASVTTAADQETISALRTRILQQWAQPPQGGALTDYEEWALAVPGVTRAWAVGNQGGNGTVTVYVMLDVAEAAYSGFPQGTNGVATAESRGTPATGDQLTVANALYPLRAVTALVYVNAPVAQPVSFTIANFAPNTAAMQAAVQAAVADMFTRLDAPGGTIYPNDWEEAIGAVPGLQTFTVSSPAAPVTAAAGALLTAGSFTFTS